MTKYFSSTFNLLHTYYIGHSGLITVNVLNFLTPFSICSQIIFCVFRTGIHKNAVRIANREDPDQTASSEAV